MDKDKIKVLDGNSNTNINKKNLKFFKDNLNYMIEHIQISAQLTKIKYDALLKEGVINKIGSEVVCQIAKNQKIPIYIIADSWKFTKKKIPLENRKLNEVWDRAPKKIKIKNPAFEFVDKKYISGIITEFGLMKYSGFLRKVS